MTRSLSATIEFTRRVRGNVVLSFVSVVLAWSCALTAVAAAAVDVAPEYSIKAGYLLLFARYTQWPDTAFSAADSPFVIAVIGADPFGSALDDTFRDQRIGSHRLKILRMENPEDALQAHIVFVSAAHEKYERRWFERFRGRQVLTVGESTDSLDAGAIVRLVEDRGNIRFDIDWSSAAQSALKIGSPMLVSARRVRGAPSGGNEATQ